MGCNDYGKKMMKNNGVDMVKDATPFMAISGGGALTLTPVLFLQIFGAIIGAAGVVLGYLRWRESQRANNINERKLNWEIDSAKGKNSAQTTTNSEGRKAEGENTGNRKGKETTEKETGSNSES